jgi:hypothetical protein
MVRGGDGNHALWSGRELKEFQNQEKPMNCIPVFLFFLF